MTGASMYQRKLLSQLVSRLKEPRRFIQVLAGPRQVGKTTLARQAMEAVGLSSHYGAADEPSLRDRLWIEQQWELGRLQAEKGEALLVLDEIQKVKGWSEAVKRLWDEDTRRGLSLKVVLLGSSHLLVQKGLTESLAGRFEILRVTHWSFDEIRDAFGWGVEQYVYFGGYPGAAGLVDDRDRWSRYIVDSLIETTLAHYLDLLAGAGLLAGLPKYHGACLKQRGSSPKLQVLNTALFSAQSHLSLEGARLDREYWGRSRGAARGVARLRCLRQVVSPEPGPSRGRTRDSAGGFPGNSRREMDGPHTQRIVREGERGPACI